MSCSKTTDRIYLEFPDGSKRLATHVREQVDDRKRYLRALTEYLGPNTSLACKEELDGLGAEIAELEIRLQSEPISLTREDHRWRTVPERAFDNVGVLGGVRRCTVCGLTDWLRASL